MGCGECGHEENVHYDYGCSYCEQCGGECGVGHSDRCGCDGWQPPDAAGWPADGWP